MNTMQFHLKIRPFWLGVACLWTIVIVIMMRLPVVQIPLSQLLQYPYADKITHFILFAGFAAFWTTALGRNFKIGLIVILLGCLFGLLTELQQMWVVSRTFSFYDFLANCLGIILGTVMTLIYEGLKS